MSEHGPDIHEFLLARIAEDEAVEYEYTDIRDGHKKPLRVIVDSVSPSARALAEARAKRTIVEMFTGDLHMKWDDGFEAGKMVVPLLGTLAAVYSDHPDFNPDWAYNPSERCDGDDEG